jgi:hypothetical protein
MSAVLDPITNPQSWDTLFIGRVESPGLCEVSGFARTYDFDVKKGKGAYGATITFTQRPPAKGSVKFYLWLPRHWDEWDIFLPLLKYDPTKKAIQAVDIYYPSLADIFITSVVTTEVGAIEHEGQGYYSRTVKLLEYFPPPPVSAVSTPKGSTTNAQLGGSKDVGNPLQSAIDKENAEMQLLLKKAQEP